MTQEIKKKVMDQFCVFFFCTKNHEALFCCVHVWMYARRDHEHMSIYNHIISIHRFILTLFVCVCVFTHIYTIFLWKERKKKCSQRCFLALFHFVPISFMHFQWCLWHSIKSSSSSSKPLYRYFYPRKNLSVMYKYCSIALQ